MRGLRHRAVPRLIVDRSTVRDSSVVAVQIFDQRKFKRKVGIREHLTRHR
jgi:hypothetical protein